MPAERAILVTVTLDQPQAALRWSAEDQAHELHELAESTGCRVVGEIIGRRHRPVAGTFLGDGKLEEIARAGDDAQAQVVIFNQELSPSQQRNIEDRLRAKTIDRTQLILDIFAQRARSQEGKLQVELAQLRYLLPRLTGKGIMLSRLGGGIGTRGPGEQRLEMDRRRIRARITRLGRELERVGQRREATRARRRESEVPVVALVGYTNAGKTTLLNRASGSLAPAKQQMFTTLDPLARRVRLPDGEWIVLTDTVGFLHDLPRQLVEAFRATLEEAQDAEMLFHVLDASDARAGDRAAAVEQLLGQLDLGTKPRITVLNKADLVGDPDVLRTLEQVYAPAAAISARTGQGLEGLWALLRTHLETILSAPVRLRLPAERGDLLTSLYRSGQVLQRREADGLVEVTARVPAKLQTSLASYIVPD